MSKNIFFIIFLITFSGLFDLTKLENPNDSNFSKAIDSKINSKFIKAYISGRFFNQGEIKVFREGSLNDAICAAGGIKIIKGPLNFIRFNNDGTITKRSFKYKRNAKRGSYKKPILLAGDIVYLGGTLLSNTAQIFGEIKAHFSNAFSTYGLYNAITN